MSLLNQIFILIILISFTNRCIIRTEGEKRGGIPLLLLRQMEYLQAVIENGNFYLAAEQCHVSQSAISQQIKKLEDELGVKLLERHNRTFSLTPAGEHFYRKSLIIS